MFGNPFFVNIWIHISISYTLWCVCQSSCLNLFLNCFLLSATATHDICMTLTVHQKKQFPYHDFIRNMLVIIHPKTDFVSNWYSLLPRMRFILHWFPPNRKKNQCPFIKNNIWLSMYTNFYNFHIIIKSALMMSLRWRRKDCS